MKLRMRLIISYTIFACLASLILGIINNAYQVKSNGDRAENLLRATSNQVMNTLEVSINQMKQVSLLLLSDQDVLQAIRSLAFYMNTEKSTNETAKTAIEINTNKSIIRSSIYTAYNYENFFRVIVFNQSGFIGASSTTQERILNPATSVGEINWLPRVINTKGEGILIPPHPDDWGYPDRQKRVFSLVKEIQGDELGFIEVQQSEEDLRKMLELPDSTTQMILLNKGGEVFFSSEGICPDEYTQYFLKEEELFHRKNEVNGMRELISVQESEPLGLKLILIQDWSVMNRGVAAASMKSAVIMGGIFLVISLLFIVAVADLLTRPLRELRLQIEKTKLSNMNQKIQIHSRDSDMIAFAQSFQSLMNRLTESMEKERRLSLMQYQAQFDTLQAQVNPHFLYNILNVISSRGMQKDDEVICEICSYLAAMLRYSTNTKERYATLSQEMEYLNYYVYLLQARFESRLEVTIKMEEGLEKYIVPKISIQQLVENAIEHGFADESGLMKIQICGCIKESGWQIEVLDNGCGITEEGQCLLNENIAEVRSKLTNYKQNLEMEIGGMGLKSLYGRMYLLYPDEICFSVENRKGEKGVRAVIGVKHV